MVYLDNCNQYRNVHGILLLDKPVGETSNRSLRKVNDFFRAKKIGHTGTLDPLATGMLPICFGEATKFSKYLLNADKRYKVVAKFGERTDTADSYGRVINVRPVVFDRNKLNKAIEYFKKRNFQTPPMFSALKYRGRPLYDYARKGIQLSRIPRLISIYDLKVFYWDKRIISLEIHCSKGTYVRTFIDDFGIYLGCGAHVISLRRLMVSRFLPTSMVTFEKIQNVANGKLEYFSCGSVINSLYDLLLPIDSGLLNMPTVNLSLSIANRIRLGKSINIVTSLNNCLVRVTVGEEQRFIGIGEVTSTQQLVPRRLVSFFVIFLVFIF
ncbi:tRNA pseudouridine(55) synthase TruB [Blochmannia endosymbiont of Colobopsis nipponica]|nr:tRNA pseudouridine(55) synthase TruB [Blochmannia endosymbiont of Colobopsis nipponica]